LLICHFKNFHPLKSKSCGATNIQIKKKQDSHTCVKINKSLKIKNNLSILWHGNVRSGCKTSCGATAQKRTDVYEVVIHDSNLIENIYCITIFFFRCGGI